MLNAKIQKIYHNGSPVGYYTLYIPRDCEWAYIWDLNIAKDYRNKGIGTEEIKKVAEEYGTAYICPSNENSERLYARLGTAISKNQCPKELVSVFDEIGKMYLICG
jgi:GNAT superfamily N-acetyltransferase